MGDFSSKKLFISLKTQGAVACVIGD